VISAGDVGYLISGIKNQSKSRIHWRMQSYYQYYYWFWRCKTNGFCWNLSSRHWRLRRVEKLDGETTIERCFIGVLPESSAAFEVSVVDFRNVTHGNYQERLEREFNMTVITTVPNVSYHFWRRPTILIVNNPSDLPEPSRLDHVEEPLSRQQSSPNLIT
jgi:GTP-binding protein LepA